MAAIRHTIQKEVFSPVEERLVGLVNVTKPGRKKKNSFLCVSGEGSYDCSYLSARDMGGVTGKLLIFCS